MKIYHGLDEKYLNPFSRESISNFAGYLSEAKEELTFPCPKCQKEVPAKELDQYEGQCSFCWMHKGD